MVWLLLLLSANLVPVAASPDTPAAFTQAATAAGRSGAATELPCEALTEDLLLCYKREENGRRSWASSADLAGMGLDSAGARARAGQALSASPWVAQEDPAVGKWWLAQGDGRQAAVLLHPEWLAPLGASPRVACPAESTCVAWAAGSAELDRIMAVGVLKMYQSLPDAVSPVVLRWDGQKWVTWGQARPKG